MRCLVAPHGDREHPFVRSPAATTRYELIDHNKQMYPEAFAK